MSILLLAGIGAGVAVTLTRKSGPFGIFDKMSRSNLIVFFCSLCSSFWSITAACLIHTAIYGPYDLIEAAYSIVGGFGWSLLILGITGTLDIDFNARKKVSQ